MELRHEEAKAQVDKRSIRRAAVFAGTAVLFAGIALGTGFGVSQRNPVSREANAASFKESECRISSESQQRIESRLDSAVRAHQNELINRMPGADNRYVNFTVIIDREGRLQLGDAWTTPESAMMPQEINRILNVDFGNMSISPTDGYGCSLAIPVRIRSG